MKKFSKLTGQKVNDEPNSEVKVDESTLLKSKLITLMDQFLSIRFYGSNDYRFNGGGSKIQGQEMLAEAILDIISSKNIKEQTILLESLKSEVGNWEVIDKKIEILNSEKSSLNNRFKVKQLLEKYSSDPDTLIMVIENNSKKITDKNKLKDYINILSESNLKDDYKSKAVNIYSARIKQLDPNE